MATFWSLSGRESDVGADGEVGNPRGYHRNTRNVLRPISERLAVGQHLAVGISTAEDAKYAE